MFSSLKYHAVDYLYERVTRQKMFFESLSIHIPSCLYQDKNYSHNGSFADDKYRRPWARVSTDSAQIMMNISVLDLWKNCLSIEDFLEKKPISSTRYHIHKEDVEIVPSSNPCSQLDIEDACTLLKDTKRTDISCANELHSNYVPVALKEQKEGLYIDDEFVFVDNLVQYGKWRPTLQMLLSRLNIFHIQDPFSNSKGDAITEEDIFRECFNFERSVTPQSKEKQLHEDFCKVSLDEEEVLILPIPLKFYKKANISLDTEIPTCLVLKSLLQVTLEPIGNENECAKIISQDLELKTIPEKIEIPNYCSTQEVGASQSGSALEFNELASHASFHPEELDVPLTPPNRSEKLHMNLLYTQLQSEAVSPFSKSFITKYTAMQLEDLMWQSEKYPNPMNSFFLPEHQTSIPPCHHLPVKELKTLLCIHEDISVINTLEEDGMINLWEIMSFPSTLEALSIDLSDGERLVCTSMEVFSKLTHSQLDYWLEEKNSNVNTTVDAFDVPDSSRTNYSCWSPQKKKLSPSQPLGTTSVQYITSIIGDIAPTENQLQSESAKPMHFGNEPGPKNDQLHSPASCKEVSFEANSAPQKTKPAVFQLPKKCTNDFDLLNDFIMLRSKHVFIQSEEANNVAVQEEVKSLDASKEQSAAFENNDSPVVLNASVPMEQQKKENEATACIEIKASESQLQAYHVLKVAVAPIVKELMSLGLNNWRFDTLNFDDTRFFLKQQEKVISDSFQQGVTDTKAAKDTTLFRHAAILHLLVTVRDLLLTCNLNVALGYLWKAKDRYKDFLHSSLDNIWRQLTIVQLATQKNEVNPKITELHHQMSKWMQSDRTVQNKVVIVLRMEFDEETTVLINTISTVQGLTVVYLNSEEKGTFLECKTVINSLKRYSCVVIHNQHIGPDFPWTHFSVVVEYNYVENSCWIEQCKNVNVSYITFRTAVPETVETETEEFLPDNLGGVFLKLQIPYVFLASEGLLYNPDILQLLESKYNITFIERTCCEALHFFGSTDCYIVMTVDECTAIVMQNMEELNYEKSSDNIVLRLMVLSLQYSSCWVILYSRERLSHTYSLAGKTLHHLALIYAALVPFSQKAEDFEVKVALTPGVEETALLVRQIADHILMISKRHPQELLDKSWLSVLPSEAETCLLTFPCMNPLVAQIMLKKSPSIEWLLSATFDQLQELLPEVPQKVLKHFSDITSLYTLKPPKESEYLKEMVPLEENMNLAISTCSQIPISESLSSFQGQSPLTEYSGCFHEVLKYKGCSPSYCQNGSYTPLKSTARHNIMVPSVSCKTNCCFHDNTGIERQQYLKLLKNMEAERTSSSVLTPHYLGSPTYNNFQAIMPHFGSSQGDTNTYLENCPQSRRYLLKEATGQSLDTPNRKDVINVDNVKKNFVKQKQDFSHSWYHGSNKDVPFQQSSINVLRGFGACSSSEFQTEERLWDGLPFMQAVYSSPHDPSFCKRASNSDRLFNLDFHLTGEYTGKKEPNLLTSNKKEQDISADLEFTQIPELKKRRLTFEKDPGRSDGQTRLKFF